MYEFMRLLAKACRKPFSLLEFIAFYSLGYENFAPAPGFLYASPWAIFVFSLRETPAVEPTAVLRGMEVRPLK
jgi:hypothetical protein